MNIRYLTIILAAMAMAACNKSGMELPGNDSQHISLSAAISVMDATRSAGSPAIFTGTSAANMETAIWLSNECGTFTHNPQGTTNLPCRTTVRYESANPATVYLNPSDMTSPVSYPLSGQDLDTYCIGLYPMTDWSSADGKKATHPIDGNTDLMFAEQIKGRWDSHFGTQTYKHLLTWLKVSVKLTAVDAIIQWGDVTEISILNPWNQVQIDFSQTYGTASGVSYNYVATTEAVTIDGTPYARYVLFSGNKELSIGSHDFGSILCPPAATIRMKIKTSRTKEQIIDVPLKDAEGTAITSYNQTIGKLFLINLYFNAFNDIDASCSLVPWNEQSVDLYGSGNTKQQ